jgi:toxin ParE1/3/4
MAGLHFTRRAEADLLGIGEHSLHKWGATQTVRYLEALEDCCRMLTKNPAMGRRCDHIRPGLRRHEHGKHVLFSRQERGGILISRILHQRMLPERHAIDDNE